MFNLLARLQSVSADDKSRAVETMIKNSTPEFDFFFMIFLSVLMATFGLLAGSETVVIGSMLLAPILYPVLGVALGVSMSDQKLLARSFKTLAQAAAVAVATAFAATLLFSFGSFADGWNQIILSRVNPSLLFLMVGVISGLAVTYALVRPNLSETLPGVAVAVALIPPLSVVGIGLARLSIHVISGAFMLFIVNVLGIVAASSFAFSLMNIRSRHRVAQDVMEKEDTRVEVERAEIKQKAEAAAAERQKQTEAVQAQAHAATLETHATPQE